MLLALQRNAKSGELCAPDGLYRKTCSDCQQPMMCISNYCFEVCASSEVCKEADSGSSGLKVQLKCMNGSCQQYCMDDSNCEGRQLCSTIGTCAYLCNDVSCASVDRCAPDGVVGTFQTKLLAHAQSRIKSQLMDFATIELRALHCAPIHVLLANRTSTVFASINAPTTMTVMQDTCARK